MVIKIKVSYTYVYYTVQLQNFAVKYFYDFHELYINHGNFCNEISIKHSQVQGLTLTKSQNNDESQKFAKIVKIFDHRNLE